MKSIMLKIAIIALLALAALYIAGDSADSLLQNFGKPDQVRANLTTGLMIIIGISLALLFIRTLIGIIVIIALGVLIFLLYQQFYMTP